MVLMNAMSDLERRVGIFAALADQTRLRIVDLLSLGDLSSSEIGGRLGLRSNLVAHHLGVLEAAFIIVRTRSEFDRRRSYIGLRPEVFDTLAPASVSLPTRVLFVSTANAVRSQLAEAIWREVSTVAVASAGTRPAETVNPEAAASAERHQLTFDVGRRPKQVEDVVAEGDLVIALSDDVHERMLPRDHLHWSIGDPAGIGTEAAFDAVFEILSRRIRAFSARLAAT